MTKAQDQPSLFPLQPWTAKSTPVLGEDAALERQQLLIQLAESDLGRMAAKILYVLQKFPETRDSDTALAIRYWKKFQSSVIANHTPCELEVLYELDLFETISRLRRHIQNDLELFEGTLHTRQLRNERQLQFYNYMVSRRQQDPEIRFYLDETGSEPQRALTGVAGICVMDWRQFEMNYAALSKWRHEQPWPETLHFTDVSTEQDAARQLALLNELKKWRAGLLFVGHAIQARGPKFPVISSLFIQLIRDSLERMDQLGCLGDGKAIVVIKEAEEAFDKLYLADFQTELSEHLAGQFPNRAYVKSITPVQKGREVLLECADMVAGAMQRRASSGQHIPKDRLAEAVMNVTGFEDVTDEGAVFRNH